MSAQNQPVSSKRRAAGGGTFLVPSRLSLGQSLFPYRIDAFPAQELGQFAGFEPLPIPASRPAGTGTVIE